MEALEASIGDTRGKTYGKDHGRKGKGKTLEGSLNLKLLIEDRQGKEGREGHGRKEQGRKRK